VPLLSSSVTITLEGSGSGTRVSQAAAARYQLLLRAAGSAAGVVTKVVATVQASNSSLGMGTNYSYSIISGPTTTTTTPPNTASAGGAGLKAAAAVNVLAATPFAVAYAMETLLQLAAPAAQKICGGGFTVVDEPTYVHRGILLDTGRRFFPTAVVKTTIESMAMFKLNVLHFHLSEGRFRVESTTYPELNLPCSNKTCPESGQYYTKDEIKDIVDFAYLRGVRVVPEFEMPGHATALCSALKSVGIACCSGKWGMGQVGDDVDGNSTAIVGALLEEMSELFPDTVMHLGGDECAYSTSPTSPCNINASKSFEQKMFKKVLSLGKRPMGWQEVLLETGAAATVPEVIVDTWSKVDTWTTVAASGHSAVASDPGNLYLDGGATSQHVWFDISAGVANVTNQDYLMGGEASMWTDSYLPGRKCNGCCLLPSPSRDVDFAKAIGGTIWPRAAVATGSFWRWDPNLVPQTGEKQPPQLDGLNTVVAMTNAMLVARGLDTCPCANATNNGCNQGHHCGVPWCNA